jgi:hypothetical protein
MVAQKERWMVNNSLGPKNPKKKKHGVWDTMPELTITSPNVHSRSRLQHMGKPKPIVDLNPKKSQNSTLSPRQRLWIWPLIGSNPKILRNLNGRHTPTLQRKPPFMYSLSGNCAAISTFMCLWAVYSRIGPHISCSRIGRSTMGVYKSLTDTWTWNWDCVRAIPFLGIYVSNFRYWFFAFYPPKKILLKLPVMCGGILSGRGGGGGVSD